MLRHGRLGDVEYIDEVVHRSVAVSKQVEDPPTVRLNHDFEQARRHAPSMRRWQYCCQAINTPIHIFAICALCNTRGMIQRWAADRARPSWYILGCLSWAGTLRRLWSSEPRPA